MEGKKYYVFCGSNCRYEGMTKEQTLAAIAQAVESGEIHDVDTGFVTRVKEQNAGRAVTFWVGTQAQYNALENPADNCLYIITDDTKFEDIERAYAELKAEAEKNVVADITESVLLSPVLSGCEIRSSRYMYNAAQGTVSYHVCASANLTTNGATIEIAHTGGFFNDRGVEPAAAVVYAGGVVKDCTAYYSTVDETHSEIIVILDEEVTGEAVVYISGWYYCRGAAG